MVGVKGGLLVLRNHKAQFDHRFLKMLSELFAPPSLAGQTLQLAWLHIGGVLCQHSS